MNFEFATKAMTHNGISVNMNFALENYDANVRVMDIDAPLNSYPTFVF